MNTTIRIALAAGLLAGTSSTALAQSSPSAPIETLNQALMQAEKIGSQPFPVRYKALAPAVDGAFDLQQVLQTSVGLRWSSIPDAQKQQLLAVFRAYTISNYAANFNTDSGDQIKLLPETRTIGADKVVETEIVPKSGDSTRMDYVMRNTGGSWKAVDVLEQGTISQAAVQRSDFRSLIAGGADKLIASLQAKVQTLSGGTINAAGQPGSP